MYFDLCEQLLNSSLFDIFDSPRQQCHYSSPSFYIYTYSVEKEEPSDFSPKVNMFENDKKYYVQVDLPGMTRENVKMELNEEDHLLTISGERISTEDRNKEQNKEQEKNTSEDTNPTNESSHESKEVDAPKETANENKKYSLKECSYGKFNRSISLPEDADLDTIQANMENGLLKITINKVKLSPQKRTIEIQ